MSVRWGLQGKNWEGDTRHVSRAVLRAWAGSCGDCQAAVWLTEWAQVGTEVTYPPGEKAEAHLSLNEFSVLVSEGRTFTKPPTPYPSLPSPLPALQIPIPGHPTARAEPSVKFSVNISEMFSTLGSDGLGFDS